MISFRQMAEQDKRTLRRNNGNQFEPPDEFSRDYSGPTRPRRAPRSRGGVSGVRVKGKLYTPGKKGFAQFKTKRPKTAAERTRVGIGLAIL